MSTPRSRILHKQITNSTHITELSAYFQIAFANPQPAVGKVSVQKLNIRRAQVKVGLINLYKGLFSLNARIYYSIAHRQAVCNLPGGYSTILSHKEVHCSN
jgi:hypothetical protein